MGLGPSKLLCTSSSHVANGGNQFGVGTVGSRLIIVAFVDSAGSAFTAPPSLGLDAEKAPPPSTS